MLASNGRICWWCTWCNGWSVSHPNICHAIWCKNPRGSHVSIRLQLFANGKFDEQTNKGQERQVSYTPVLPALWSQSDDSCSSFTFLAPLRRFFRLRSFFAIFSITAAWTKLDIVHGIANGFRLRRAISASSAARCRGAIRTDSTGLFIRLPPFGSLGTRPEDGNGILMGSRTAGLAAERSLRIQGALIRAHIIPATRTSNQDAIRVPIFVSHN
jgi:hypothetical protein